MPVDLDGDDLAWLFHHRSKVQGSGFKVQGSRFKVQGSGSRFRFTVQVHGSKFRFHQTENPEPER
jgi:hypothetical protein